MHVVESVRTAISILRFLASQPKPYGVNAIAREVGVSPSSCFNIVKTLALEGLLRFDERDKSYAPGAGLAAMIARTSGDEQVFRDVEADLHGIAVRFSCAASFWRLAQERIILLGSVRDATALTIHLSAGLRLPALLGAMGRCIAGQSGWSRAKIESAFRKISWGKPPSFRSYMRDAVLARQTGWAIDIDNYMRGLTTIAATIRDGEGKIQFCVANIILSGSQPRGELEKLGSATAALATDLGARLFATARAFSDL